MRELGVYSGLSIDSQPNMWDLSSAVYFLNYGYFPSPKGKFCDPLWSCEPSQASSPEEILGEICGRISFKWDEICVPLSGGIDSRILLGFALQNYESTKISTITYGIPGSWDFEIPKKIAKDLDLKSLYVDLTHVNYDDSSVIERVRGVNGRTNLFHMPAPKAINEFIGDRLVWSGIFGDVVAGSAAPRVNIDNFDEAIDTYLSSKRLVASPVCEDYDFSKYFDQASLPNRFNLDYSEALLFFHRLPRFYMPHIFYGDSSFFAPFLCQELIGSILGDNLSQKSRMLAYRKIVDYAHKKTKLFNYPLKNFSGESIYSSDLKKSTSRIIHGIGRKVFKTSHHLNFTNWNATSEILRLKEACTRQKKYVSIEFPELFEILEQAGFFGSLGHDIEAMLNFLSLTAIYREYS